LNLSGAEKLSSYFGVLLQETYGLEDRHDEDWLVELWQKNAMFYREDMREQMGQ
jgi:hypothetical protein